MPSLKHFKHLCVLIVAVCGVLWAAPDAFAQTDDWEVNIAPLYFWAATNSGNLAINGTRDVPVFLDFADAKDKLAGAFSFHGEARKGHWGVLGDINFIRLSTDVNFTTPILSVPIAGSLEFDQTIFNGKVSFAPKPGGPFSLVGGIRTVTLSPTATFTGPIGVQLADISPSTTEVVGVAGFIYRPKLGNKWVLLTQADIGGGSAFSWSAVGGIEFVIKPWIGVAAAYAALDIDTGNVPKSGPVPINDVQYAVTQYGPAFSLTFHWGGK